MPDQFWGLTPSELNMIIEVYEETKKEQHKNMITYAYYGAVFQRNKNPSGDLEKIINKIDEGEEMSDADMLSALKKYVGS